MVKMEECRVIPEHVCEMIAGDQGWALENAVVVGRDKTIYLHPAARILQEYSKHYVVHIVIGANGHRHVDGSLTTKKWKRVRVRPGQVMRAHSKNGFDCL